MSGAGMPWTDMHNQKKNSFLSVIVFSIAFHIFLLLVVPLTVHMFWKPKEFKRPKTFQLIQPAIPKTVPKPPAPPVEKTAEPVAPPKSEPKPAPKPEPKPAPKPETKPVEKPKPAEAAKPQPKPDPEPPKEDLSELAELLGGLPVPAAELSMGADFKYGWYINAMRNKIERNWKPSVQNPDLSVVVRFVVMVNGTIGDVGVERSSGSASLDNMAVRAVSLAAPFGKLPPGFSENQLQVECTLRPTRR